MLDHRQPHAQQHARTRQVLGARDRRLRAQIPRLGQPLHRELEHRVTAQRIGVIAILVTGRDHQHPEPDDLVETMDHALRRARIIDAPGKAPSNAKPLLDCA